MNTRANPGFTLLEMIVALAVLGFLLAGLSQTIRFGLTAWYQDGRLSNEKIDLEAVDRTIRTIVENLAPGDGNGPPPIEGTSATIGGITWLRLPGAGVEPVPTEVALAVSGSRLVLRWRPHHHWTPLGPQAPPAETELIGGVARFNVSYWGASGVWVSNWGEPNLPLLIRFRIALAGAHAQRWPDIVVAPLLARQ